MLELGGVRVPSGIGPSRLELREANHPMAFVVQKCDRVNFKERTTKSRRTLENFSKTMVRDPEQPLLGFRLGSMFIMYLFGCAGASTRLYPHENICHQDNPSARKSRRTIELPKSWCAPSSRRFAATRAPRGELRRVPAGGPRFSPLNLPELSL